MNLLSKWKNHLQENSMTYMEHFIFALYHGLLCVLAGCYLIFHAVLPCFFQTAGSDLVAKLNKTFKQTKPD
jgi:hypothetical protein